MKLIYCQACGDVVKLIPEATRSCQCEACCGRYEDDGFYAMYSGALAVPLGIDNTTMLLAIEKQHDSESRGLVAFVIGRQCPTMRRVELAEMGA